MNALANALASDRLNAMVSGSVHAKRSEVKGPDLTSPDLTFRGLLRSVVDGETSSSSSPKVMRASGDV